MVLNIRSLYKHKVINVLLNIIRTLYPIRNGNYNFSERKIQKNSKELFLKIFKKNEHSIIIGFHESGSKKQVKVYCQKRNMIKIFS